MVRRMSGDLYLYMITGLPMLSVYDDDTVTDVRLDVQTNVRRSLTCVKRHVQHFDVFNVPFRTLFDPGRSPTVCVRAPGGVCMSMGRSACSYWHLVREEYSPGLFVSNFSRVQTPLSARGGSTLHELLHYSFIVYKSQSKFSADATTLRL
jgi:hypothetical protein